MTQCKEYGREYEVGFREFCSEECFKINVQKPINDTTAKESSHTNKLTKEK